MRLAEDTDLQRRIVNYLFQRNVRSIRDVAVDVQNGLVVLQGRVNSFYEKQLCLNCCQRVAGVNKLVDNIEVA